MVKGPRRYGKTSLIKELLKEEEYIYIDLMNRTKIEAIVEQLLDQAYAMVGVAGFVGKAKKQISELFQAKSLKGEVSIGDLSIGVEIVNSDDDDSCGKLMKALETVDGLGKKIDRKITIVFDEFQEIVKFECRYDILAALRATLQQQQYTHLVFLGSVESVMSKIFSEKKSPFYNYCRQFQLEPFNTEELQKDLVKLFMQEKIVFENYDDLEKLLKRLNGHPANTMLTMQILYYIVLGKKSAMVVKAQDLEEAFDSAYRERKDASIQMLLRAKTKKHYHELLYTMANALPHELGAATLYKVRQGLQEMGLLVKRGRDTYLIADNFLEEYLREN